MRLIPQSLLDRLTLILIAGLLLALALSFLIRREGEETFARAVSNNAWIRSSQWGRYSTVRTRANASRRFDFFDKMNGLSEPQPCRPVKVQCSSC
jgi:hypothetical protein